MRELLKLILSVQMVFAPIAFAQNPAPPAERSAQSEAGVIPAEPPRPGSAGHSIECPELQCTPFVELQDNQEAQKEIAKQLGADNRDRKCEALKEREFLKRMIEIYEAQPEACMRCIENLRRAVAVARSDTTGAAGLRGISNFLTCKQQPAPSTTTAQSAPPPRQPATPAYQAEEPVVTAPPPARGRQSSYVEETVDTGWDGNGGGGSWMNSNMMWGIGGLALGGILGYMIGKNSAQQHQPPPYWQGLGPMGPQMGGPLGQVPPRGPFGPMPPFRYPMGGGFGMPGGMGGPFGYRAPNFLPYGGAYGGGGVYGQPGSNSMMPIGGYQGGVGLGNYNLGTGFSNGCGFCSTGTNWGGYNAPIYLPYR